LNDAPAEAETFAKRCVSRRRHAAHQERRLFVLEITRRALNRVEHVALRDEDVAPAVVIEVCEARAPAGIEQCDLADAGSVRDVVERHLARVQVERVGFVREGGDKDVRAAVVVEVGGVHAHPREGLAVLVVADA
jgi:hypothetical protein